MFKNENRKRVLWSIIGPVMLFTVPLIDYFSDPERKLPILASYVSDSFRPITELLKLEMIHIFSNYLLYISLISLLGFIVIDLLWKFYFKASSGNSLEGFKKKQYPITCVVVFFCILSLHIYLAYSMIGVKMIGNFAPIILYHLLIYIVSFVILPLSCFFPMKYAEIPFFALNKKE